MKGMFIYEKSKRRNLFKVLLIQIGDFSLRCELS